MKPSMKMTPSKAKYSCPKCGVTFSHKTNLTRHLKSHSQEIHKCGQCGKAFGRIDVLKKHMKTHKINIPDPCTDKSAFEGTTLKKVINVAKKDQHDLIVALHSNQKMLEKELNAGMETMKALKWHIIVKVNFVKSIGETIEHIIAYFNGACHTILVDDHIQETMEQSYMKIHNSFIEYQRNGSSWTLDAVEEIHLKITKYKPIQGSSYIPTPTKLIKKNCIVNPQNKDNKCFMWSILAGIYPAQKNPQRISKYTAYVNELDFTGIGFPVKLADVKKFEKQNEISVNVFGYEDGEVFPLQLTQFRCPSHFNLLLLSKNKIQHFCLIKHLDRLLAHTKSHGGKTYFCNYCLQGFTSDLILKNHIENCSVHAPIKILLPDEKDKWLKFKDYEKSLRVPYAVYCDFESVQQRIPLNQPNDNRTQTVRTREHKASGFTYKIVSSLPGEKFPYVTYRGQNTAEVFIHHMLEVEKDLKHRLKTNIPMTMSPEDEHTFQNSENCHVCGRRLDDDRVRDHDHFTGVFRGAAHNSCNLNFKNRSWIPVFFHNLRG